MSFEFAVSKQDITPGFPTCLACSQKKDTLFERIHDNIFVRCVVLNSDGHFIVILSYDLLFHSRDLYDFVYNHVKSFAVVNMSDILINYTHNHNAPSVRGYNDFSSSDEYEELLKSKTISVINEAFSNMKSGYLEYGVIPGNWNINRRLPTNDGIKLAPNPDGPSDKNMYVIKFLSSDHSLKGLIINYACHPVHYPDTLGLTSEYPGFLCRSIEKDIPGCMPVFIQGAGADTRPLGTVDNDRFVHRSFEYIESMADSMKEVLVKSLNTNAYKPVIPNFNSVSFSVEIPTDDEGCEFFYDNSLNDTISAHLRRNADYMYRNYDSISNSFTLQCGLIKLSNNLVIAHMGGEPVCQVKFLLEKVLLEFNVIFAGYTDACSYIVIDSMIAEDGYEVQCFLEYMHKGRIKKGIDKILISAFKEAIKGL